MCILNMTCLKKENSTILLSQMLLDIHLKCMTKKNNTLLIRQSHEMPFYKLNFKCPLCLCL